MRPRPMPLVMSTLALAVAAAALCTATPVQADPLSFLQTGFAGGAAVQGRFTGSDLDGDGWVQREELSDFHLQFTGNHAIAAFSHDLSSLTSFTFGSGIGRFGAEPLVLEIQSLAVQGERITSYGTHAWPLAFAEGVVMELPSFVLSASGDTLQVGAVPEPAVPAMLLCGLAVLGWLQRRRAPTA